MRKDIVTVSVPYVKRNGLHTLDAVALVLGNVIGNYVVKTKHHFNGGTYADQLKIIMLNEYERRGTLEFDSVELLALWNEKSDHPRSRQTLAQTISTMKKQGIVVDTGTKRGSLTCFSLRKILETKHEEILTEVSNEIEDPGHYLISYISELKTLVSDKFAEIEQLIELDSEVQGKFNETVGEFKHSLKEFVESARSDAERHNNAIESANAAINRIVVTIERNFQEIEEYFNQLTSHKTSSASESQVWREGYKAGWRDGREEFRDEFKPVNSELTK